MRLQKLIFAENRALELLNVSISTNSSSRKGGPAGCTQVSYAGHIVTHTHLNKENKSHLLRNALVLKKGTVELIEGD